MALVVSNGSRIVYADGDLFPLEIKVCFELSLWLLLDLYTQARMAALFEIKRELLEEEIEPYFVRYVGLHHYTSLSELLLAFCAIHSEKWMLRDC